ncbi:hypothetical protein PSHT_06885 [Puccinia striiformis]|uniref:Uncharacterized protein n=4 Tax=Puccinia striiformis TaxID=27350 RepID=A0A0L0V270_9BASI|nr:hypothetical protein PSTG_13214 [Puccinia striiformis f. sp. tritici PST-78]POV97508.1 hypothetical protein PSTT_15006 [Puccinia striiformis]POW04020.1 hypothetical protein PSTT_10728 [Puccinia striiformis]POW15994.1 hypothetical protein PSHT_06885 [Puccinia striiformis]
MIEYSRVLDNSTRNPTTRLEGRIKYLCGFLLSSIPSTISLECHGLQTTTLWFIFAIGIEYCWNVDNDTSPRKRRANSGCSSIELQNSKRIACNDQSHVNDVYNLNDHDQRSSNLKNQNPSIDNFNAADLLDRVYPPVSGESHSQR